MNHEVFQLQSDLLKSLAHPKRLEIVHLLRDQSLSVTQMQTMLDLHQANLSQHLSVLRQSGIVSCKKIGKTVLYHLTHQNYILASDLIRSALTEKHSQSHLTLAPLSIDPVCGMRLSPLTAPFVYEHDGINYYFCATGCHKKFTQDPQKYINSQKI